MLSYQRYYTLVTLLLFIILNAVYFFSDSDSIGIKTQQVSLSNNSIVSKFKTYKLGEEQTILKLNFKNQTGAEKNIIEIAETNIRKVSLIVKDGKSFKLFNWFKSAPNEEKTLSHNPYFEINATQLPLYLIYSKSAINPLTVKLYSINHFFNKQANQGIINIILILIILFICLTAFSVFIKIKNSYTILFCVYIFLSLISYLLFNGFANNFWPFSIHYVADHILCALLALHVCIICYFLVLLINKSLASKSLTRIVYSVFIFSIFTFCLTLILDSYLMLSYLIYLIAISSCTFLISYPQIFKRFKNKEAYKLNFLGILLLTVVFFIHSLKHLNIIHASFLLDTSLKMLYVGHIVFVFSAFILINKKKIVQIYLNTNQPLMNRSFINGSQNNSEILATLSNREMEVLEFVAKGYTDKNLSEQLFVSVATVKTHKQRIYKKLGINNKAQATQIYTEFIAHQLNFTNISLLDV